jgi:guanine deaminase
MMSRAAQLKREHPDCWVNTHISENPSEIRTARQEFPDCPDYTAVHERHGLLGAKFTAGHGIWLSDDEFRRFAKAGAAVAFCPMSNFFLGSGLFRLGRALDPEHRVRLAIGTDMGGGNSFSLTRVLDEAYKVGLCNNTMLDGSVNPREQDLAEAERNKLSPYRAFYLATLGGAQALYLDDVLGNFQPGKEADFVALDWTAGPYALAWHQALTTTADTPATIDEAAELLFGVMAVGDDRNVAETWVAGQCVYRKQAADTSRTPVPSFSLGAPVDAVATPQTSPASL